MEKGGRGRGRGIEREGRNRGEGREKGIERGRIERGGKREEDRKGEKKKGRGG